MNVAGAPVAVQRLWQQRAGLTGRVRDRFAGAAFSLRWRRSA